MLPTNLIPVRSCLNISDSLTVSETATEPPHAEDGPNINSPKSLATEALYINQNFRRMVLRRVSYLLFVLDKLEMHQFRIYSKHLFELCS